jgi:hypothetical protein
LSQKRLCDQKRRLRDQVSPAAHAGHSHSLFAQPEEIAKYRDKNADEGPKKR